MSIRENVDKRVFLTFLLRPNHILVFKLDIFGSRKLKSAFKSKSLDIDSTMADVPSTRKSEF